MIEITHGNLLTADAEALVNSVNTDGYMGKGIALQFKKAFPDNFAAYRRTCEQGALQPGQMLVFDTGHLWHPRYIINFPTKRNWRANSRLEDIESGLQALIIEVRRLGIRSIAVPPLGCGLGGLDWRVVRPLIERAFAGEANLRVLLFEPQDVPSAAAMPIGTPRPHLTPARALLIKLMAQYTELPYRLTLLEVQKLAYFLQEAGEPLRLQYQKGIYGPYAHNLNKVLELLEGHYIRGYGDSQAPDVEIRLMPDATEEAMAFLAGALETQARLDRLASLIDGFETPYGMELLASVHWLATHDPATATTPESATALMQGWNPRKRRMFQPSHVRIAWERLSDTGWIPLA